MKSSVRAEISKKNKYWLERHRFHELRQFCLQYDYWKRMLHTIDGLAKPPLKDDILLQKKIKDVCSDPTVEAVIMREYYQKRISMLEDVAKRTDSIVGNYILKGVTQNKSYDVLCAFERVPCGKDMYYELYRKFFWLLDDIRG